MIDKHIRSLKTVKNEVRDDIAKGDKDVKLVYIFTVLTSLIDKYTEDEEEIKLTDGTERYHR